jgi:hypothetical protein
MIRITMELVSAISPDRNRVLGIAEIANDGKESVATKGMYGSYTAKFSKWSPKLTETWKSGKVENFNRIKRGAWDLLYLALKSAVGERNDH